MSVFEVVKRMCPLPDKFVIAVDLTSADLRQVDAATDDAWSIRNLQLLRNAAVAGTVVRVQVVMALVASTHSWLADFAGRVEMSPEDDRLFLAMSRLLSDAAFELLEIAQVRPDAILG